MGAPFQGLSRGAGLRVPSDPNPSPALSLATDVSGMCKAVWAGIERYLETHCNGALAGSLGFAGLARAAAASDLYDAIKDLEVELDQALLTKMEADKVREMFGRYEVLCKSLIRAIAIARTRNGGELG